MTIKEIEDKLQAYTALYTFLEQFKNCSKKNQMKMIDEVKKNIDYLNDKYEEMKNYG